jgi:hypothetical protein
MEKVRCRKMDTIDFKYREGTIQDWLDESLRQESTGHSYLITPPLPFLILNGHQPLGPATLRCSVTEATKAW